VPSCSPATAPVSASPKLFPSNLPISTRYTAVSPATIGKTISPLDLLLKPAKPKATKR
jgi:hypothetical protein